MNKYKTKRIRENREIIAEISWSYEAGEVYIASLTVVSFCRGRGIGKDLVMNVLKRYSGKTVNLNAIPDSLIFWDRLGFVFDEGYTTTMKVDDILRKNSHLSSSNQ